MPPSPALVWFRRDLRLSDHAALSAAVAAGGPVIPVFILDPETEALGAAPKWRLGLSVAALAQALAARGSRLILRRGPAREVLRALTAETGARAVHWTRLYDPASVARDRGVKAALKADGIAATSHPGHVLFEPMGVTTGQGGYFRVYTPFWRAVKDREVPLPLSAPGTLQAPDAWPGSDDMATWAMGGAMNRGAEIVCAHQSVGEDAAQDRLAAFTAARIGAYKAERDRPDIEATSRLSENLTYGEISAAAVWHAGYAGMLRGAAGAEHFLKELVWRDFAWHLIHHTPHIVRDNWRPEWNGFPWQADDVPRWSRGMTGEPMVDAGMRQMYVTGSMHNRLRMLVASYLTKHLMTHWRIGMDWFADCLTDWDPASNAMGWQWTAGSGPDAAPYFRIYNPALQAEKFDPEGLYRRRFVAGFEGSRHPDALSYFDAIPRSWGLTATSPYPAPMVGLDAGRMRALRVHEDFVASRRDLAV